jgi:hypothetical protein
VPKKFELKIGPPHPKQQEIIDYIFDPDPDTVKMVDVCCGRGYGKSVVAIDIAIRALNIGPEQVGLFLEPDWKRVNRVFLKKWRKIVPKEMYTLNKGEQCITWFNGALLYYGPRNITGNSGAADDSQLGQDTTFIIDDEAALRCSYQMYLNNLATIRVKSPIRFYLTISTPRVGAYKRLITSVGHKIFQGRTIDNPYNPPGYEANLRANMSKETARRELDGEFVSLEGRIWKKVVMDKSWPAGNISDTHPRYNPSQPWWLFADLGGATGAYVVVQKTTARYRGMTMFDGPVWVAVADFCSNSDASATRAFKLLDSHFGCPAAIVAGADINTRDRGTGRTVSYFAQQVWGNVQILPCDEDISSRQIQYDRMSYLVESSNGQRRFCVARDYKELDDNAKRGVLQMFEEDAWPDESKRRAGDFLPKNKEIMVQHVRDALLMGAYQIMSPPTWLHSKNTAA